MVSVAVPAAVYLGWNAAVAQLLGVSSSGGASNQLGLPGAGILEVLPQWTVLELAACTLLLIGATAAWRTGDHAARTVVAVNLGFASIMGGVVWAQWWAFSRPMLPIMALAVAGLGQRTSPAEPTSKTGSSRETAHQPVAAAATTSTR